MTNNSSRPFTLLFPTRPTASLFRGSVSLASLLLKVIEATKWIKTFSHSVNSNFNPPASPGLVTNIFSWDPFSLPLDSNQFKRKVRTNNWIPALPRRYLLLVLDICFRGRFGDKFSTPTTNVHNQSASQNVCQCRVVGSVDKMPYSSDWWPTFPSGCVFMLWDQKGKSIW